MGKDWMPCQVRNIGLIFAVSSITAQATPRITLGADIAYGAISGYTQIPAGGAAATTSNKQPTYDELGIKRNFLYNFNAALNWQHWGAYAHYRRIYLNGAKNLSSALTTHNTTFAAGTYVKSRTHFNLINLGGQYRVPINQMLTLTPSVGAVLMMFNYHIEGGGASTSRHFNAFSPSLGLNGEAMLNQRIGLNLAGSSTVPGVTNLYLGDVRGGVDYLALRSKKVQVKVNTGLGYMALHFKDKQSTPNEMKLHAAPYVYAGASVNF